MERLARVCRRVTNIYNNNITITGSYIYPDY